MSEKNDRYLTEPVGKLFLRYLIPGVATSILISGTYLVDTICVGQKIGESGLAALNVVVPITGFLYALGFLFGYGSSNLFSNTLGMGEEKKARAYYGTTVLALLFITLLISGVGLAWNDQIAEFLCDGADFKSDTAAYLWYVFLFAPFFCFEVFYSVYVRNDGAPGMSLLGSIVGNGSNIILDILFVWVFDWGMSGAALATGIAVILGTAVYLLSTMRRSSHIKLRYIRLRLQLLPEVVKNGAADFLREISSSLVILLVNVLLLRLSGPTAVSAYGVIANLGTIIICGLCGVANSIQPLVSYNIGAGEKERVHRFLRIGVLTCVGAGLAYVVFAEAFPQLLVRAFLEEPTPELWAVALIGIRIISPGYVLASLSIMLCMYCESVHAQKEAFLSAVFRGLAAPVLLIFLFTARYGVTGVWLGYLTSEVFSFIFSLFMRRCADIKISDGRIAFRTD